MRLGTKIILYLFLNTLWLWAGLKLFPLPVQHQSTYTTDVYVQELKELAALAYRDTTAENREYWKNEMGQAIREIHQVYDDKLEGMRGELETYYNLKVYSYAAE